MRRPLGRPLAGTLAALLCAGATVAAGTGTAAAATTAPAAATAATKEAPAALKGAPLAAKTKAVDFAGTVALSNCSGSLVRMPNSADTDPALVLTNGHCLETGMPEAGEVITDQPSSRTFSLLNSTAGKVATLRAAKVAYATMTDTDVTLYQLDTTYAAVKQRYGINALVLSGDHPTAGAAIKVVSGYWKKIYTCNADGFVPELHEADWVWKDSMRYTAPCNIIGGTSGSPVVDVKTGKVVAVNNTANEDGDRCTMNNPCEVDENGNTTVRKGIGYAQETYGLTKCIATGNKLDLSLPGCTLPKP
ncbi:serine protease [Streptomyces mashuensis]|uniref:Serine protease n=1 Tax=Streptomyces mashuensis TaxID=33904 RepID=A0A919B842_9ACTN|nr:serine protease [Streptomyces mashuensis]GHF61007.1 serine protease [Streptomyces mashuensis]